MTMKKLLAAIVAGMFAITATAPVFAADKMEKKEKSEKKKDAKKKDAKKKDAKKKDEKK
jgi:pentapeptide MXKDX repeat protein